MRRYPARQSEKPAIPFECLAEEEPIALGPMRYDAAGNLLSRANAAGTLEFGYDAANRPIEVGDGEATLRSYGLDSANRLTGATDAEGHKIEIGYNEDSLPSSIKDGRGQSLANTYNSRGLLTKQEDGRGTLKYEYDKLGRLRSRVGSNGDWAMRAAVLA